MTRLYITLLSLFSVPAYAFPLTAASFTNNLLLMIPVLLSGSIALKSKFWKGLSAFLLLVCALLYMSFQTKGIMLKSASQQQYHSVNGTNMEQQLIYVESEFLLPLAQQDDVLYVYVHERPTVRIPGSFIYSPNEADEIVDKFQSGQYKRLILTSPDSKSANTVAMEIHKQIRIPIYYGYLSYVDYAKAIGEHDISVTQFPVEKTKKRQADVIKNYNYFTIGTSQLFVNDLYGEGHVIPKHEIMSLAQPRWDKLAKSIDKTKETVIFFPDLHQHDKLEQEAIRTVSAHIAYKLGVDSVMYSTLRLGSSLTYDNSITPWYKNHNRIITPSEMYVRHTQWLNDYHVLCYSDECVDVFPYGYASNVYERPFVALDNKLIFNVGSLHDLQDKKIIQAPHDDQSVNLAYRLGEQLSHNGFDYQGLTYHPSLYYGGTYINNNIVHPDDILMRFQYSLYETWLSITPDQPIIEDDNLLFMLATVIGLLLAMSKNNHKQLIALNIALVYFVLAFDKFVLIDEKYYQAPIVPSYVFAVLMALLTYGNGSSKKTSVFIVALCSLTFWEFVPPVLDLFIAFIVLSQFFFSSNLIPLHNIRSFNGGFDPRTTLIELGDKCKMTLPFVHKKQHGDIITPDCNYLSLNFGKKYLLRSNHLTPDEQRHAGIYKTYDLTQDNANHVLNVAMREAKEVLPESKIQFWLQQKVDCAQSGVLSSFHEFNCLDAAYSIGEPENVTEGRCSNYHALSRIEAHNDALEKKLFKLLTKIEKHYQQGVTIEFGIDKKGKLHVFQVRYATYSADMNKEMLTDWVNLKQKSKVIQNVDNLPITPFGSSVLFKLFQNRVFSSAAGSYVLTEAEKHKHIGSVAINETIAKLVEINQRKSEYSSITILTSDIANVLAPLVGPYFSLDPEEACYEPVDQTIAHINQVMTSSGRIQAVDFDAGSKFIELSVASYKSNDGRFIARDMYHAIFTLGSFIIGSRANEISSDAYSGVHYMDFDRGLRIEAKENSTLSGEYRIIVPGVFGEAVSVKEFLASSTPHEQHIVADSIPSSLIGNVMKAKSITLNHGNELSHIAITAKGLNIPLRIMS